MDAYKNVGKLGLSIGENSAPNFRSAKLGELKGRENRPVPLYRISRRQCVISHYRSRASVVPDALAAAAFEHSSDGSALRVHHRSDKLHFLAADAARSG